MTRSKGGAHRAGALIAMLATIAATVVAQQPSTRAEPAELQIRTSLRAFYFSLAHHDWEALTAGILPAKVVAHHPAPAAIVAASQPHERPANCTPAIAERLEDAEITIDSGWAASRWPGAAPVKSAPARWAPTMLEWTSFGSSSSTGAGGSSTSNFPTILAPSSLQGRCASRGSKQSPSTRSDRKSIRGNGVDLIAELVVAH
jgi:hypothetical protein